MSSPRIEVRPRFLGFFAQKLEREHRGVAFVHVVASQVGVAERAQHTHAADSQQNFLAQPIVGVAAVQRAGQRAILLRIRFQRGVQKIDRNDEAVDTFDVVAPGAQLDAAVLERHGYAGRLFFQKVFDPPDHGIFGLGSIFSQSLCEISAAIEERDCDHRQLDVGRRSDRVSRQNAQAAAVTRHGVLQGDLHRKIRNDALRGATRLHHVSRHPVWLDTNTLATRRKTA